VKAKANQEYNREDLVPEITRSLNRALLVIFDGLERNRDGACRSMAKPLLEAGVIRRN
jgi:hypothetical protein